MLMVALLLFVVFSVVVVFVGFVADFVPVLFLQLLFRFCWLFVVAFVVANVNVIVAAAVAEIITGFVMLIMK